MNLRVLVFDGIRNWLKPDQCSRKQNFTVNQQISAFLNSMHGSDRLLMKTPK